MSSKGRVFHYRTKSNPKITSLSSLGSYARGASESQSGDLIPKEHVYMTPNQLTVVQRKRVDKTLLQKHKHERILLQIASGQHIDHDGVPKPTTHQEKEHIRQEVFFKNMSTSHQKLPTLNDNSWNNISLFCAKSCMLGFPKTTIKNEEKAIVRKICKESSRSKNGGSPRISSSSCSPPHQTSAPGDGQNQDLLRTDDFVLKLSKSDISSKPSSPCTSAHKDKEAANGSKGMRKIREILRSSASIDRQLTHNEVESHINKHARYLHINPFDFASLHKQPRLMDVYNRSGLVRHYFDEKLTEKLNGFKSPQINYLRPPVSNQKVKIDVNVGDSDVQDLNSKERMEHEIEVHEQAKAFATPANVEDRNIITLSMARYRSLLHV